MKAKTVVLIIKHKKTLGKLYNLHCKIKFHFGLLKGKLIKIINNEKLQDFIFDYKRGYYKINNILKRKIER